MAKTSLQKAYDKEIKRINRFIKNATKRGFVFNEEAIQEMIPERGKKITAKKIEILKKIKAPKLYSKATYINPETGEVTSGFKGRESERKAAAQKGLKTRKPPEEEFPEWEDTETIDSIVAQLLEMIGMTYAPGYEGFMLLISVLQTKYGGIEDVARAIEPVPDVLNVMYSNVLWESNGSVIQKQASQSVLNTIAAASGMNKDELEEFKKEVEEIYV